MQPVIPHEGHEPGVYFGMSEDAYHSDPAIGSTDIRKLLTAPSEFHYSWAGNPEREQQEETEALTFGHAVHRLVLEGTQAFLAEYAPKPDGPDVLVTADDMKGWLKARGLLDKGTKEAMADRILAIDPSVKIQDVILAEHKRNGRKILSDAAYRRIMLASAYITKNPHLARSFSGGQSEVSVFWIRRGIRMKCRFDYLRVIKWQDRRTAVISDLKSFGSRIKPGQSLAQSVTEAAGGYRHQPAHYMDGLGHAKRLIRDGLVHGSVDLDWLQRVQTSEAMLFAFVFYKSAGSPYAQAKLLQRQNPILESARADIESALDTFATYHNHFGAAGPWVTLDPPEELSIEELPRWML
ncbi:hypothetical protein Mpop_2719 [Methylorubrum populi BJ001]|jgi:hypothetical protein|uniref:Uncharacterized protein n=1 Tax=Methylorubrum populi (strain ATCC BAA-705 / NCIMB 13946 / BJ001) TaxID=441620 RepID=B1ZD05_METPB|nr:PD-(D/E)XK nuclease-like domain-containing protein [Methylorubrum populi]ACB80874.1 hypothetical protein Mpop_2719 [Methylorubrum populi BJ001]